MKSVFAKTRWRRLRLLLVVLLPLHAGFAQAAMAASPAGHAATVISADEGMVMSDGMPCHHPADSTPAPDHSGQHKAGCCDAGNCHCAVACGLCFTIACIRTQPGMGAPPFSYLSVPAASHPPDLRPPIG